LDLVCVILDMWAGLRTTQAPHNVNNNCVVRIGLINMLNMSKSLADYYTSSTLDKAVNKTAGNVAREYVKTGMALANPAKVSKDDKWQSQLQADALACLQRIADRASSPKAFCKNIWQIQTLVSDMLTFDIMNCDPFDVKLILTAQNEQAVVTRHAFTNTLKQVLVRTVALQYRQALGLNNLKMSDLDCVWADVVLSENIDGSDLLNELEDVAGLKWS